VRGWGSIVRKTPDIGLASYSIIPLRLDAVRNTIQLLYAITTIYSVILLTQQLPFFTIQKEGF
jgi:hypothetical protein